MSFAIGQLTKKNSGGYMSKIDVTASTITSPNTFGQTDNIFTDFALAGTFTPGVVYYLRFKIHKIPEYFYSGIDKNRVDVYLQDADTLTLSILLKNNDDTDPEELNNPPEIIGTCKIPKAKWNEPDGYSTFAFVFTPSSTFSRLGFRIQRVSYDAIETAENKKRNWLLDTETDVTVQRWNQAGEQVSITTTGPRIIWGNNEDADLCILNNIVNVLSGWLKFGYQSRPGNLIVVNKLPIRVGRSGIYEINNGTKIEEFMIASPGGSEAEKIDAFLLDYAYDNR